jgi:hypothetical protein
MEQAKLLRLGGDVDGTGPERTPGTTLGVTR